MAGVVEQRRAQLAVLAGDPRDEQRVVGRLVGVVAAGEPLAPRRPRSRGWSASAQRPVPYVTQAGASASLRLEDRCADLLGQVLDVGLRSARAPGLSVSWELTFAPAWVCDMLISSAASSSPVRSRIVARSSRSSGHVLEPAEVDRDERQRRPVAVERREDGGRGGERTVDPLGGVVRRGAPGAGVDPDRRRHVACGDAEPAVRVAKGLVHCQPSPSFERCRRMCSSCRRRPARRA